MENRPVAHAVSGEKIENEKQKALGELMAKITDALAKNKIARDKLTSDTKLKGAELSIEAAGDQMDAEGKAKDRLSKEQLEGYRMGLQMAQQLMQQQGGDNSDN